jgi:hypothetical protein
MTRMADEIKTAATHAGYAEKYDSMKEVSLHLRHVLNCLIGPSDKRFDKAAGDPCQGQGNGILPDIKASMGEDQEYPVAWRLAHVGSRPSRWAISPGQGRPGISLTSNSRPCRRSKHPDGGPPACGAGTTITNTSPSAPRAPE